MLAKYTPPVISTGQENKTRYAGLCNRRLYLYCSVCTTLPVFTPTKAREALSWDLEIIRRAQTAGHAPLHRGPADFLL